MKTTNARKTSTAVAANIVAMANSARTRLDAERAHMAYAVGRATMSAADAFVALGAVEGAQRRVRLAA